MAIRTGVLLYFRLMHWPDPETWRFINTFAPWFSAAASFAAVATALYLSMTGRRITLSVYATVVTILHGRDRTGQDFIGITVVNMGQPDATITNIAWEVGFPFLKTTFVQAGIDGRSSAIPTRLKHGDFAEFYIPLEGTDDHWVKKTQGHLGKWPKLIVWTMRVLVTSSTGKVFRRRVSKQIRQLLTGTPDHHV